MFSKARVISLLLCAAGTVFSQTEDYSTWSYSRLIRINTTASGANIFGNVTGFPLLIRLNPNGFIPVVVADAGAVSVTSISSDNIDVLTQAKPAGEDLRFCRLLADGKLGPSLPYEIERWNRSSSLQAEIWVRVDSLYGNSSTQGIMMFWGRSDAPARSNGPAVFDSSRFVGVWHLGNLTGNSAGTYAARPNAVAGGQVALPSGGNRPAGFPQRSGVIAFSDTLRGGADTNRVNQDHLDLGAGYADFSNGLTMSMWVKPAPPLLPNWNVLLALGNGAPKDNLTLGRNGTTRGFFGEVYNNTTGAGRTEITDTLVHNEWHLLTFTVQGALQTLYRDGGHGAFVTRNAAVTIPNVNRTMAYVGRSLWPDPGFAGAVDEVRIHKVARDADWLALEYETQKPGSAILSFRSVPAIPVLTAPAANATGVPINLYLTWNSVMAAPYYDQVQLALDSSFSAPMLLDGTQVNRTQLAGPLSYNTAYYWRVRTYNSEGASLWTTVRKFTTEPAPTTVPAAPVLMSPALFATQQSLTPTLAWQPPAGAASYRLQVSTVSNFATMVTDDSTVTASPRTLGPFAGNRDHYWRVRGKNSFGAGAWSDTWVFTTMTVIPDAPALALPAAFATNVALPATLSWNASPGATSYRVDLSLSSSFGTYVWIDSAVTGLTRGTGNLAGHTDHYWRVRAKNNAGVSPYSEIRRFTTGDPVALKPGEISLSQVRLGSGGFLRVNLTERRQVSAALFDTQGKRVAVLWDGPLDAGTYRLALPKGLAEGPRILEFQAGAFHKTLLVRP